MADSNDGLILYLPLTEPLTSGPIDRSPANHGVRVLGSPRLIADPLLGAAHQFTKIDSLTFGYLSELKSLDQPFTLQMWLRRNADTYPAPVLSFFAGPSNSSIVFASWLQGLCGFRHTADHDLFLKYPDCLMAGQWTNLALVGDGKQVSLYQNGVLRKEGGAPIAATAFDGRFFGSSQDTTFALAQVRVHNRVLTPEELNQQLAADMTLRTAYTESHPIVLSLLDANDTATIYITDEPTGEPLTLEFFNAAQRPVFLDTIDGNPGVGSCHFELRFRPGALYKLSATPGPSQLKLTGTSDWAMSDPVVQPDGTVSFYLLHQAPDKQPFDIESERTVRLQLTNVRADPATGARASRLELRYSHLHVGDPTNAVVTGSRISYFSVVNRIGRQNLPIHVGFIGGNTVLPGGSASSQLRLRLVNISPDQPIPWQPGNPQNSEASFFRVSFDFEQDHEEKDWALARLNESKNITVTAPRNDGGGRWIGTHTGVVQQLQDGQKIAYAFELEQPPAFTLEDKQQVVYQYPPSGARQGILFATNYMAWSGLLPNRLALAVAPSSPQKGSQLYLWPPLWHVTPAPQGEAPSWTVWSEDVTDLQQSEFVELLIGGIVTSLPPGHANLYVDYDNIPGYQPGRFVAIVEKSPIQLTQEANGAASVQVHAALDAATSEIYFTDTEHNHTGLGNAAGHAAIENAKNYDALMVLGRMDPAKQKRQLKLYDDVEIAGNLSVDGTVRSGFALDAATSEVYFTDTEQNWNSRSLGADTAAIVNAKDLNALLILGRLDRTKYKRQLNLYDDVRIAGSLSFPFQLSHWEVAVNGADLVLTHSQSDGKFANSFTFGADGTLKINGKKVVVE